MRTVSFSSPEVQETISSNFVATLTNIQGETSAGSSFAHESDSEPTLVGKTAGRQNTQLVFMTPKGKMFHVATGFRSEAALLEELQFATTHYEDLKGAMSSKAIVTEHHMNFLAENGYTEEQIETGVVNGVNEASSKFCNGDFGDPTNRISEQDRNVIKYRVLADRRYILEHPLISHKDFSNAPEELAGNGGTFFGGLRRENGEFSLPTELKARRAITRAAQSDVLKKNISALRRRQKR